MWWDQIDAHYHAMPRIPGRKGSPLFALSPSSFAGHIYSWAIERVPHDKLEEWEQELLDLLPWQGSDSDAAEEIESASFYANYSG